MWFFDDIIDSTKKATNFIWGSHVKHTLNCPSVLEKTAKWLSWELVLTSAEKCKITDIDWTLIEAVDPVIWKSQEEADILWKLKALKWFTLQAEKEKKLSLSLPIRFANEHKKTKIWWDMKLLNQMSERSKKTAVNYNLIITFSYQFDGEEKVRKKKIKHSIRFE